MDVRLRSMKGFRDLLLGHVSHHPLSNPRDIKVRSDRDASHESYNCGYPFQLGIQGKEQSCVDLA